MPLRLECYDPWAPQNVPSEERWTRKSLWVLTEGSDGQSHWTQGSHVRSPFVLEAPFWAHSKFVRTVVCTVSWPRADCQASRRTAVDSAFKSHLSFQSSQPPGLPGATPGRASTPCWAGSASWLFRSVSALLVARVSLSSGKREPGWKYIRVEEIGKSRISRPSGQSGQGHHLSVFLCVCLCLCVAFLIHLSQIPARLSSLLLSASFFISHTQSKRAAPGLGVLRASKKGGLRLVQSLSLSQDKTSQVFGQSAV